MSNMNTEAMAENTQKKNVGYRLFAVLLVAVCALAVAVLSFSAIYKVAGADIQKASLLTLIQDMLASNSGDSILPSLAVSGIVGTIYTLATYLFVAGVAIAAILSLVAIFYGAKAPLLVRTALFYLTAGAILYTFSYTLALKTYAENKMLTSPAQPVISSFDIASLAIAVGGLVFYFIFAAKKIGKKALFHLMEAVLSVAFSVLLISAIAKSNALVAKDADSLEKILVLVGTAVMYVSALISIGRITREGGIVFDLIRYIIVVISALLVVAKASDPLFGIFAAIVVVVQIVLLITQLSKQPAPVEPEVIEKEVIVKEEPIGFETEEFVEAYPYEGGPVAGVLLAEEVNPSFLPHEPHVTTAGYDFYNCKSFDPFIATLDAAERNEFTELFILKFKGTMPELPDYVVGGDNKEFFRKMFIYLGQYRDRMSQELLMKIYQFSMKI